MGLGGLSGSNKKSLLFRAIRAVRPVRDMYDYLWHGRAAADPLGAHIAFVHGRFEAVLDTDGLDVPTGASDRSSTTSPASSHATSRGQLSRA